nr:reverse transcriptase domain-containing protein [Tanacetum cinerariifolium]
MATDGNGDPPVPDLRTMEELCQPTLNGRGGPIAPIAIQATNSGLKNDRIQQVQNSCLFHRLPGDDANKHLDKFLHVTQSIKVNGVIDDALLQSSQHSEWFSQPKKPPTPDHDWNKTLPAVQGSTQTWISELARQVDSRSSFNELLDTLLDFSNFIMNRLRVDTLTPELLAGPTFELMKGSCTSLIELEYHLEEVYKATTEQLDWVNPEGQQYPHNLLQPLPLILDNRGRRVIPFAHFINNDLEYLQGGASSRKYTTSLTKTKAADYGNIKWIEDLFYGFTVNRESALDVYSKRRIIAVTDLKIVEWHSYKHLDWITVRRDDVKLYKFKEGDFKRVTRSVTGMEVKNEKIVCRVLDLWIAILDYSYRLDFRFG